MAIARLEFSVSRPQSINRSLRPKKNRDGEFIGFVSRGGAKLFKARVAIMAKIALASCTTWPRDPWRATHVEIGYALWNTRLDSDAPSKAIRDALERVLFQNDAVCSDGPHPLPQHDGGEPRVDVYCILHTIRTEAEARARERKSMLAKAARIRRKREKDAVARERDFLQAREGRALGKLSHT